LNLYLSKGRPTHPVKLSRSLLVCPKNSANFAQGFIFRLQRQTLRYIGKNRFFWPAPIDLPTPAKTSAKLGQVERGPGAVAIPRSVRRQGSLELSLKAT
ncbi:unnamed protein product, partial [Nesidiocoris tenuis]